MVLKNLGPFAPPSVLPDISPSREEIGGGTAARAEIGSTGMASTKAAGVISPLVGEMSGRTEGGSVGRWRGHFTIIPPLVA
jgi:precorrin-3B synthase